MLIRLRMLKLSVGKGRQVIALHVGHGQVYTATALTMAAVRAGYVLQSALVCGNNDPLP